MTYFVIGGWERASCWLSHFLTGLVSPGKYQMEAMDGVVFASWLAMVWVEMGPGYCQYGVYGFAMAVGRETLRCGEACQRGSVGQYYYWACSNHQGKS